MPSRLDQQLAFILEIDKLKSIYRRTILLDRSRNENSAEHSWHIALMVPLLAEHADQKIDVPRTMKMLLVHDIVEIDAGDTYCYDASGYQDKAQRERCAAERIFGLLPEDQRTEYRALWEEFEQMQTRESRFANALDRLQPLLNNYHTQGESWIKNGATSPQVQKRAAKITEASKSLGAFADGLVNSAVAKGYLPK